VDQRAAPLKSSGAVLQIGIHTGFVGSIPAPFPEVLPQGGGAMALQADTSAISPRASGKETEEEVM